MPFAHARDGFHLYYEVTGGDPDSRVVLLLTGLGVRGELWGDMRDVLAADGYRVLTMDNRGIGRSAGTWSDLTSAAMADDAVAVLQAASVRRAHVVGASLGGMVAQQLALQSPEFLDVLVLQSTTAGMRRVSLVPPSGLPSFAAYMRSRVGGGSVERCERAMLRLLTTKSYADRAALADPRLTPLFDALTTADSFLIQAAQFRAAWNHNAWSALKRIVAPTLVQHGTDDRMISVRAGRAIGNLLPRACLDLYPDTGHLVAIERPESMASTRNFLRRFENELETRGARPCESRRAPAGSEGGPSRGFRPGHPALDSVLVQSSLRSPGEVHQMAQPVVRRGRKARLLQVAAELFSQNGYHNVSMNDIADVLGITGPALYRHFRSKHQILAESLMEQLTAVEVVAQRAVDSDSGPEGQFEQLLNELGQLVLSHEDVLLWTRERRHLTGEEQAQSRRHFRNILRLVATVIARRSPEKSPDDVELVAWAILTLYGNFREYRFGRDAAATADYLFSVALALVETDLETARREAGDEPPLVFRKPAGRRERVVDAAATLFYERGYQAVGIEDIADASDSAIATVYQHFDGKAAVLTAVLQRGAEGLHYVTTHRLARCRTPEQVLDELLLSYVDLALGPHRRLLGILVEDLVSLPAEEQDAIRKSEREYVDEWVAAIVAARPEFTAAEARARAQTVISLVTNLVRIVRIRQRPAIHAELRMLAVAVLAS